MNDETEKANEPSRIGDQHTHRLLPVDVCVHSRRRASIQFTDERTFKRGDRIDLYISGNPPRIHCTAAFRIVPDKGA